MGQSHFGGGITRCEELIVHAKFLKTQLPTAVISTAGNIAHHSTLVTLATPSESYTNTNFMSARVHLFSAFNPEN